MSNTISLHLIKSLKELQNVTVRKRSIQMVSYEYNCSLCNKLCTWVGTKKQFQSRKWCPSALICKNCLKIDIARKTKIAKANMTEKDKSIMVQRYKQTLLQRYGVSNTTYLPDHIDKTIKTCQRKYGVDKRRIWEITIRSLA